MEILDSIKNYGIIPVIDMQCEEDAEKLAIALSHGGLSIAEVTFRNSCAVQVISRMKKACPHMLVGAGTVLTIEQVDEARKAGAEFIVSPGFNEKVVKYCQAKGIFMIPGCATPSDIEKALSLNIHIVKFFPAEANGGLAYIKSIAAPYKDMLFMPTGGINEENVNTYLQYPKVIACGGTWMVKKELLDRKAFDEIEKLARRAVFRILNLKISAFNKEYAYIEVSNLKRAKFHLENMGILLHNQWQNDEYKFRLIERESV